MNFGFNLRKMRIGWAEAVGSPYNCSTKYIVSNLRARLIADGISVGSMACISEQINAMTSPSKAECYATQLWLRMQSEGVVTGDYTCLVNQYKSILGEQ